MFMGQRFTKPPSHFLLNPRGLAYLLGDLDLPVHGFRGSQHQITRKLDLNYDARAVVEGC